MWTKHSCADGETIEAVAKKYKIKKPAEIWKYPDNAKLEKAYKSAQAFKKGDKLTVPDPKAKVYVGKHGGKDFVISKAEYDRLLKDLDKEMEDVFQKLRVALENATRRHDAQLAINGKFPLVSYLSGGSKGPSTQRGMAENMLKQVKTIQSARKYKEFPTIAKASQDMTNAYRTALARWLDEVCGSAENWATGISLVRDGSFVIFSAAAATAAAPATLGATLMVGGGVGAGTGFMSSAGTQLGKVAAGEKVKAVGSLESIAWATFRGGCLGALGGAAGRALTKGVVDKIAARISSNSTASSIAGKLVGSSKPYSQLFRSVADTEMAALRRAGLNVSGVSVDAMYKQVAAKSMAKLMARIGAGSSMKVIDKLAIKPFETYVKANATKIGGSADPKKLAIVIADGITTAKMLEEVFVKTLDANRAKLEKEFKAEIRQLLLEEAKKAPAS